MRILALSLFLSLSVFPALSIATDEALPSDVVLSPSSPEIKTLAINNLTRLLENRSAQKLSSAFSDATSARGASFLLGTFSSQDVTELPAFVLSNTAFGNGKLKLTKDAPLMSFRIVGANSREQRDYLAGQLLQTLPVGVPKTIRAANFNELALIWYFIGWDLDDPVLVADWGDQQFAFDYDASGEKITWIERLSTPCFKLGTEEKILLECHCMKIERQGNDWQPVFSPSDKTPSCKK